MEDAQAPQSPVRDSGSSAVRLEAGDPLDGERVRVLRSPATPQRARDRGLSFV
ncbi:MAG TPA: hypothetical protein VHI77_02935 [Solirubrobacterales bacterium]|nr:hypothetical protein [Solirubrobacterales bacterium]